MTGPAGPQISAGTAESPPGWASRPRSSRPASGFWLFAVLLVFAPSSSSWKRSRWPASRRPGCCRGL